MTSLIYSKFLLSMSMWGLSALAVFEVHKTGLRFRFRRDLFQGLVNFFSESHYRFFALTFLVILLSFPYSSNMEDWLVRLRVKIPFIVMPLSFFLLPKLQKKHIVIILYWTVMMLTWSAIQIMWNYASDPSYYLDLISKGKHLPTPMHHIRYSMLLVFGIFSGFYLLIELSRIRLYERLFLILCTLLLVVFLHILSVRTGIVLFYASLLLVVSYWVVYKKKYNLLISFPVFAWLTILLAYNTIPSFKTKLDYSHWDMMQFMDNKVRGYSDSERILSIQVGWELFREKPFLGTGLGDLQDEMKRAYNEMLGEELNKRPHNQFITFLAGSGILGFVLFIIGFYGPLRKVHFGDWLLLLSYFMISLSFMVENTIDSSIGTGLVLGIILILMQRESSNV